MKNKIRKYKYIVTDCVSLDDYLSSYKLVSSYWISRIFPGSDLLWSDAVRVDVTDLEFDDTDDCYLYSDSPKIGELNPKIFVRKNWKWEEDESLTKKWLEGSLPKDSRHKYLESQKDIHWTFRGYFTNDKYSLYEDYQNQLLEECKSFLLNQYKSVISEEDFNIFKRWKVDRDVAKMIYLYRKEDWKYISKFHVDNYLNIAKVSDELYSNGNKKVKKFIKTLKDVDFDD